MNRPIVVAALALAATPPGAAGATTLSGLTRISPTGSAASALARQGVRLSPEAGADSAKTGALTAYLFPAGEATFGATNRLKLTGTLALRRGTGGRARTVRLTALQLRLGSRTGSRVLSGKIGARRLDLFTLDLRRSEYTVDARSTVVRIEGTRAALTTGAARAIARGLALRAVKAGTFGVLATTASAPVAAAGTGGASTLPGGGSTAAPGAGAVTTPAGTTFTPPTPLARPTTAVDVTSSQLRWRLRESFVRYVKSGEGVTASGGATPGPISADGTTYDYDFTPAGGWYDPASGTARLLFKGQIAFSYTGHGIDIRFADPQIELAGAQSRVLATFASAKASQFSGLGEFVSLELAKANTSASSGPVLVYSALPARVTPWANEAVMSGFYPAPDDAFGALDLRLTRGA